LLRIAKVTSNVFVRLYSVLSIGLWRMMSQENLAEEVPPPPLLPPLPLPPDEVLVGKGVAVVNTGVRVGGDNGEGVSEGIAAAASVSWAATVCATDVATWPCASIVSATEVATRSSTSSGLGV
jgi:hypothetical protein